MRGRLCQGEPGFSSSLLATTRRRMLPRGNDQGANQKNQARHGPHDHGRSGPWRASGSRPRRHLRAAGHPQRRLLRCVGEERRKNPYRPYPPRTGRRLHGARRRAGDGKAASLLRRPWTGAAQLRGCAAHRLRHECARARAVRPDPAGRHWPGLRASPRNPRSGRHHRAARRPLGAHSRAKRRAAPDRRGDTVHVHGPAGPGGARMRHRRLGTLRRSSRGTAACRAGAAC